MENITGTIGRNNTQGVAVDPNIFEFFDTLIAREWQFENVISNENPIHVIGSSLAQSFPECSHDDTGRSGEVWSLKVSLIEFIC